MGRYLSSRPDSLTHLDEGAGMAAVATSDTFRDLAEAPPDVVDRLLWRSACLVLARHQAGADGRCVQCGQSHPCAPYQIAQHADVASRKGWDVVPSARGDAVPSGNPSAD